MSTKRKLHSTNFKAKVALEVYKADKTSAELVSTHKVTSGQVLNYAGYSTPLKKPAVMTLDPSQYFDGFETSPRQASK